MPPILLPKRTVEITAAFNAQTDTNLRLIDLGAAAEQIVQSNSADGIHPEPGGSSQLADLLYRQF